MGNELRRSVVLLNVVVRRIAMKNVALLPAAQREMARRHPNDDVARKKRRNARDEHLLIDVHPAALQELPVVLKLFDERQMPIT